MIETTHKYVKNSAARLAAVQSLYEIIMMDSNSTAAMENYFEFFEGGKVPVHKDIEVNTDFYKTLLSEAYNNYEDVNHMIDASLPSHITPERLDILARAILIAGVSELRHNLKTDAPVIINEYINITHAFYSGKEHALVNGILNTLAKKIRE